MGAGSSEPLFIHQLIKIVIPSMFYFFPVLLYAFCADVQMRSPRSHIDGRVKTCVPIILRCNAETRASVCPVADPNIVQTCIEIAPVDQTCTLELIGSAAGAGDHISPSFSCNVGGQTTAAINCVFECDRGKGLPDCQGQQPNCNCQGGRSISKLSSRSIPLGVLEWLAVVVIVSNAIIMLWLFWRKDKDGHRGFRKLDWAGYRSTGEFRALFDGADTKKKKEHIKRSEYIFE